MSSTDEARFAKLDAVCDKLEAEAKTIERSAEYHAEVCRDLTSTLDLLTTPDPGDEDMDDLSKARFLVTIFPPTEAEKQRSAKLDHRFIMSLWRRLF